MATTTSSPSINRLENYNTTPNATAKAKEEATAISHSSARISSDKPEASLSTETEWVKVETRLHIAMKTGNLKAAQEILSKTPRDSLMNVIEAQDCDGNTPACYAVMHGQTQALDFLIRQYYANAQHQNKQGHSLLHLAVIHQKPDILKFIAKHSGKPTCHVNPMLTDKHGRTALQLAEHLSFAGIKELLMGSHGPLQKILNLSFSGASVRGAAYIAALETLINKKRLQLEDIQCFDGTSAGSMIAALLGVGYSIKEMKEIILNEDFKKFLDSPEFQDDDGKFLKALQDAAGKGMTTWQVISNIKNFFQTLSILKEKQGVCSGTYFRNRIETLIRAKTGIENATFAEIKEKTGKKIFLVGTNVNKGQIEVFSPDHTPDMCLADAVRISMSIPFLFEPALKYIKKDSVRMVDPEGHLYVDGGLCSNNNGPTWMQDSAQNRGGSTDRFQVNPETLGFRIVPWNIEKDGFQVPAIPTTDLKNLESYASAIASCFTTTQIDERTRLEDYPRTVYINSNVSILDFDLTKEDKENLMISGQLAAERFLQREGKDTYVPGLALTSQPPVVAQATETKAKADRPPAPLLIFPAPGAPLPALLLGPGPAALPLPPLPAEPAPTSILSASPPTALSSSGTPVPTLPIPPLTFTDQNNRPPIPTTSEGASHDSQGLGFRRCKCTVL